MEPTDPEREFDGERFGMGAAGSPLPDVACMEKAAAKCARSPHIASQFPLDRMSSVA